MDIGNIKVKTSKPRVAQFIDQCSSILNGSDEYNTAYSPSYSNIFNLLTSLTEDLRTGKKSSNLRDESVHSNINLCSKRVKRKRTEMSKATNSINDETERWNQILEVLCDYAMLHLGGRKYISKRLYYYEDNTIENVDSMVIENSNRGNNKSKNVVSNLNNANSANEVDEISILASRDNLSNISNMIEPILVEQHNQVNFNSNSLSTSLFDEQNNQSINTDTCICKDRVLGFCPYNGKLRYHKPCDKVMKESYRSVLLNEQLKSLNIEFQKPTNSYDIGRWGEELVYKYLSQSNLNLNSKVVWLNEFNESKASYDITVETSISNGTNRPLTKTTFIEVKSTGYSDNNVCEISLYEWQFATSLPKINYHIYRVYCAGDLSRVHVTIITDVLSAIQEGSVRLCLAV